MHLTIVRFKSNTIATIGKLFIDGKFECYTLEDEYRAVKVHGETRIPAGTYRVDLRISPKFTPVYGHKMLWIKDVPGFEYVLFHKGNTDKDTMGCVLVGKTFEKDTITQSKLAYDVFYKKVSDEVNSGRPVNVTLVDYDLS